MSRAYLAKLRFFNCLFFTRIYSLFSWGHLLSWRIYSLSRKVYLLSQRIYSLSQDLFTLSEDLFALSEGLFALSECLFALLEGLFALSAGHWIVFIKYDCMKETSEPQQRASYINGAKNTWLFRIMPN